VIYFCITLKIRITFRRKNERIKLKLYKKGFIHLLVTHTSIVYFDKLLSSHENKYINTKCFATNFKKLCIFGKLVKFIKFLMLINKIKIILKPVTFFLVAVSKPTTKMFKLKNIILNYQLFKNLRKHCELLLFWPNNFIIFGLTTQRLFLF